MSEAPAVSLQGIKVWCDLHPGEAKVQIFVWELNLIVTELIELRRRVELLEAWNRPIG